MSQSQPERRFEASQGDSSDCIDIFVDGLGDATPPPSPLSFQERLANRRVVDSYAIHPDKLQQLNNAALHLGRDRAALIREGLDLVLEKYRDQLGDLLNRKPPGDVTNPQNDPSSL